MKWIRRSKITLSQDYTELELEKFLERLEALRLIKLRKFIVSKKRKLVLCGLLKSIFVLNFFHLIRARLDVLGHFPAVPFKIFTTNL